MLFIGCLNTSGVSRYEPGDGALPTDVLNHRWLGRIGLAVAIGIAYFLVSRLGMALHEATNVDFSIPPTLLARQRRDRVT
jgi:hypothetical protein